MFEGEVRWFSCGSQGSFSVNSKTKTSSNHQIGGAGDDDDFRNCKMDSSLGDYMASSSSAPKSNRRKKTATRVICFPEEEHKVHTNYSTFLANPTSLRMDAQPFLYVRSPNSSLNSNAADEIHRLRSQRGSFRRRDVACPIQVAPLNSDAIPITKLTSFKSMRSDICAGGGIEDEDDEESTLAGNVWGEHQALFLTKNSMGGSSPPSELSLERSLESCHIISFHCGRGSDDFIPAPAAPTAVETNAALSISLISLGSRCAEVIFKG